MSSEFLDPAPKDFKWPRCPEADRFIEDNLLKFLKRHPFARRLAERMQTETSTVFSAWVDHLIFPKKHYAADQVKEQGFLIDLRGARPTGAVVYWHPFADLPRVLVSTKTKDLGCAVMVENLEQFQKAHQLSLEIQGSPNSSYRFIRLSEGGAEFFVVERRGTLDLVPEKKAKGDLYVACLEQWNKRKRLFKSDPAGMKETLELAKNIASKVGTGPAANIFLEGERAYWQSRNHAAQTQKTRQDSLGLGWANHDHHTFRSSRSQFPTLIEILLALGFKKRERYYAGADAGWGAQIMEQPEAGLIIFADVDLAPEDSTVDFSRVALPNLAKPGTVGLWCALHGDSMLQAGMHHLELKFDFERLKKDLLEKNVETMPPFSDFTYLRQAFTKAEMWKVPVERLDPLKASGALSPEAYEQIKAHGAVGSHMENLQRHEGFKGFNQRGVSSIITAVNAEKVALARRTEQGAA